MDEADLLLTTAEIAVAFAGFAGLISAIGRSAAPDPRLAAFYLRVALEIALFVVAFSLVPFIPLTYGLAPLVAWRLSSFLFVVCSQIISFGVTRRYFKAGLGATRRAQITIVILSLGADLLLLANALGAFPSVAFTVYLTGLFANLGLAGFYFLLVVGSVFSSPSDGQRDDGA